MSKKPEPLSIIAFKAPGPKWQLVGTATSRSAAAVIIGKEWAQGHLARIVSAVKSQVKAKAS